MRVQRVLLLSLVASQCLLVLAKKYCKPSQSCWPTNAEIFSFKKLMNDTGEALVVTEGDPGWPSNGLAFNLAETKIPAFIVYVQNIDTVRKALTWAKEKKIRVSIISTGHSFPARCTAEDSMQISVTEMKKITVDTKCKAHSLGCLKAQSGVTWGEVYREANKYGRIVVGGSNPTVGVTGWTLGGGHSPLSRSFGLGVDNVLEFHLITADLSEVWASEDGTKMVRVNGSTEEYKDTSLFWALRGGGSAFGVVIDITYRMYMDKKIGQFFCSYPAFGDGFSKVYEVMYKSLLPLLQSAPNTFSGYIIPSIGCDPATKQCGGTSMVSLLHYGPSSDEPEWVKKFADLPHEWAAAGLVGGNCFVKDHNSFYEYELTVPNSTWTNMYMGGSLIQDDLVSDSDAFINTLLRHYDMAYNEAKQDPAYNLLGTFIWVGGAVKNVSEDDLPVHPGWRKALFTYSASTAWEFKVPPQTPTKQIQAVRDLHTDLARFSRGKYYNEAEFDMRPDVWKSEFFGDQKYNRLLTIKKAWDPTNMFTCVQCVGSDWNPDKDTVIG